jgi:hypothetical protein
MIQQAVITTVAIVIMIITIHNTTTTMTIISTILQHTANTIPSVQQVMDVILEAV